MHQVHTDLSPGMTVLDNNHHEYLVEELLGAGGFGAVYRVREKLTQKNFALKEVINSTSHEQERFLFESEVLMRLEHPALPRVHEVFEDDRGKHGYMIMDYIEGPNLEMLRQKQPGRRFSLPHVLNIMLPILQAVAYLHQEQPPIIHRDIKPANIIVPQEGSNTVLVDFGIAKEYDEDKTTTALRHCTPGYAAPEQYSGGTGPYTDIYALGATMYALLTGIVPVDAIKRMESISSTGVDPLKPANELVPAIPSAIARTIEKAMFTNSARRFATVEEFWRSLMTYTVRAETAEPVLTPEELSPVVPPYEKAEVRIIPHHTNRPTRRRIGKRESLTLLLTAGFVIAVLIATGFQLGLLKTQSQITLPSRVVHVRSLPTLTPTPTPTPTPQRPTPTPTSSITVDVQMASTYAGTAGDISTTPSRTVNIFLDDVQQQNETFQGKFSGFNVKNTPLTGFITVAHHLSFTIMLADGHTQLYFEGAQTDTKLLSGTYCVINAGGQCTTRPPYGPWSVQPVQP